MSESMVPASLLCETCGPVAVDAREVEVHVNRGEDLVLYAFVCPHCGELGSGGCRERARQLLLGGAIWRELRSVAAPPLDEDDVTEFLRWIECGEPWEESPPLACEQP